MRSLVCCVGLLFVSIGVRADVYEIETGDDQIKCSLQSLNQKQMLQLLVGARRTLPGAYISSYAAVKINVLNDSSQAIRLDKKKYVDGLDFFNGAGTVYITKEDMLTRYCADPLVAAILTLFTGGFVGLTALSSFFAIDSNGHEQDLFIVLSIFEA